MTIVLAALAAALIGAAGPWILRRVPEPPQPDADKIAYAVLAQLPFLGAWLAGTSAVMAGVIAWRIDHAELVPVWVVISGVGSWLAFIDWRTKLLPFLVVAPTYVVTLALVALGALLLDDLDVLQRAVIANVIVYAVFWILHWIAGRFNGGSFGYGDVRLSGVLALALGSLGTDQVVVGIYGGFILGAVLGVILSRLHLIDPRSYAFGPYMILGAVIGAAFGPAVYGG